MNGIQEASSQELKYWPKNHTTSIILFKLNLSKTSSIPPLPSYGLSYPLTDFLLSILSTVSKGHESKGEKPS